MQLNAIVVKFKLHNIAICDNLISQGENNMAQTNNSIPVQRQQWIMDYLSNHDSISIKETAELCKVSEATARRDLDELALSGVLERSHGGATLHHGTGIEIFHAEKMKVMIPEKLSIAKAAVELVRDGDSIFLDSGTTTFILAEQLASFKRLTVVTNNLDIAYSTRLDTSSIMIVTGGIRRDGYSVLVGDIGEDFIRKLYVDIAFLGADAVSANSGIYNSNFMEIGIKKSILSSGKKKVLLVDHHKFTQKALTKVCDLEELDYIITDSGIGEDDQKILEEKVPHLIVV